MHNSKIVERYHQIIYNIKTKNKAIDATCGNGYDTLFLADYFNEVIAMDIQTLAIKRTKEKTKELNNVKVYQDDFNNLKKYGKADLIIFNLGFLPGSNRKIKTQDYSSNNAILEAYNILIGTLIIACYIQHDGGYDEYLKIIKTLKEHNIKYTLEDDFDNKEKLIIIQK